jgi:hypothetical protein
MNVDRAIAPEAHRGRFLAGLGQALGIWLAALLVAPFVRHLAVAWAAVIAGVLACILLGQWHQRRGRVDSAVGAFTGAVLWPAVIGAALIAVNVVDQMSGYE